MNLCLLGVSLDCPPGSATRDAPTVARPVFTPQSQNQNGKVTVTHAQSARSTRSDSWSTAITPSKRPPPSPEAVSLRDVGARAPLPRKSLYDWKAILPGVSASQGQGATADRPPPENSSLGGRLLAAIPGDMLGPQSWDWDWMADFPPVLDTQTLLQGQTNRRVDLNDPHQQQQQPAYGLDAQEVQREERLEDSQFRIHQSPTSISPPKYGRPQWSEGSIAHAGDKRNGLSGSVGGDQSVHQDPHTINLPEPFQLTPNFSTIIPSIEDMGEVWPQKGPGSSPATPFAYQPIAKLWPTRAESVVPAAPFPFIPRVEPGQTRGRRYLALDGEPFYDLGEDQDPRAQQGHARLALVGWVSCGKSVTHNNLVTLSHLPGGVGGRPPRLFDDTFFESITAFVRDRPNAPGLIDGAVHTSWSNALQASEWTRLRNNTSWWSSDLIGTVCRAIAEGPAAKIKAYRAEHPGYQPCRYVEGLLPWAKTATGHRPVLDAPPDGRPPWTALGPNVDWRTMTTIGVISVNWQLHFACMAVFGPQRLVVVFDGVGGRYDHPDLARVGHHDSACLIK